MSKELVISANRHETKVAVLEDDQLVEVFFQRANEYSLAGSIHKGRVTRVLPGMQSAFVDLGLERDTFLYVSDFFEENEDFDRVPVSREAPPPERILRAPERLERAESPEPPEETSSPAEPSASTAVDAVETAPAAPASQLERRDEGDRGDRRGRRSRRRRNRGRGFPDSKYAPEVSRPVRVEEAPRPAEAAREPRPDESAASGDFAVLPGESLAKYRGSGIPPLDEAEAEEIRNLQEPDAAHSEVTAALAAEPSSEEEEEPQEDSPVRFGAATALIEEEEEEEYGSGLPAEEPDSGDAPAMLAPAARPEPYPEETVGPVAVADRFETESGSESETGAATAPAGEASSPASQLTAQLREPGGRYMHRLPRRVRRKMRGGPQGESRGDSEIRSSPALGPIAVESDTARPDGPRGAARPAKSSMPSITELLKEGQEIIVQIAKEPLGQKGARITSHIALPGRFVVYMPTLEHTGVSRKIASDEERLRLKRILQIHHAGIPGGFIVRTAGEGKSEDELAADMNFLFNLWLDIRQKAEKKPAPALLHHDLDIVQRTLRDQFTDQFKAVWVDNEELYESVLRFVQRFQPGLVNRIKLFTRPEPIFDAFSITAELEKALRPKVWLKSGGHIVINQTEALVAIDVNTGKYVGRSNRLEDTIVKTNTEAVKEIVRQIRLRDLGGIIVVDFIDMDERKNRQKVMQTLEDAMRADHAPYKILQFNDFGLVAITRKRVKQSLERALCMGCPYCEGAGYVKSVQTIIGEILQEAHKVAAAVEGKDVMLRVHPDVAKVLKSHQNKYLEELEEILRRPVLVKGDPLLHHEKFDLT